jgi:triphosphatase
LSGATEVELKILLQEDEQARLRRHAGLTSRRLRPRRSQSLVSIYFDTPSHALAGAGIALRLRKSGRSWVQTVKFGKNGGNGFFARSEIERPAPGGRLALDGPDPDGVFAAISQASGQETLSPVFETRVKRVTERLGADDGSEVELALDEGEVVANGASLPIREAEIELLSGDVGAVYDVAHMLFPTGPVRFADVSKAERGYRLAAGRGDPAVRARNAGSLGYDAATNVENVARDTFRDCFAQIAANMVVVAGTDEIEGPHQLRVGLRRLRTAFAAFSESLGAEVLAELSERARGLGQAVGRLRDLDVLIDEVVAANAAGIDVPARHALISALDRRRRQVREEVRAELAAPGSVAFLFDLSRLIETRGWLSPTDYSQTARLAAPIADVAPALLDKRYGKAARRGRRIRELDAEGLHELRKELKKLRYTADALAPIYPGRKVAAYIKALKRLQDQFGSLNDAAMANDYLGGSEAPGRDDPAAQRCAGWVLGALSVRVAHDRPLLFDRWDAFAGEKPFWK